ncbi:hypothetical protein A2950_01290 [Candidatus Kaiserbacteria bacterium RIFCSPLOWO2_01_FULL_55_19]|uniref:Uncharacterized protein n=1 Tax=Candidatus Kaiserbacteria bacterium RIFCSPLOWO2_01_FULL_55_19 TaxID=1798516 RepID=A0A1F6ESH5_9BACT|nr:MAG: hypothetical protein A2950_01290 [Candidatus Kaiserbacteria bacterium RIFCSPLOWO2_01_FULL_55_19]
MKGRSQVNIYFSMLIITIFASLATIAIVEVATTNIIAAATSGNEATYAALRESILESRL